MTSQDVEKKSTADEPTTPQECYDLARRYALGLDIRSDAAEAIKWYRAAAELGHAKAQSELGWRMFKRYGTERDETEMVKWYRAAAEQGDPRGTGELGRCYLLGLGVPKDMDEAYRLCKIAAEKGYCIASTMLGARYKIGSGVPKDEVEAQKWFDKAAKQKAAEQFAEYHEYARCKPSPRAAKAQLLIAGCYETGNGVQQNYEKAVEWYLKAASPDNEYRGSKKVFDYGASALYDLGKLYLDGPKCIRNIKEGIAMFRAAAERGHAEAMLRLGLCYHEGKGVVQDNEQTIFWMQKAANGRFGLDAAKEWLNENENKTK